MATRDTPLKESNPAPSVPDDQAAQAAAADADGVDQLATRQFVYHVNPATNQVLKVEELDPGTGQRKELPMSSTPYDPYAGSDQQGAQSQGMYDPYAAGYDPQAGYADYGGHGGYAGAMQADPYGAMLNFPRCFPPLCYPPRCLPPRCWPPVCLPPGCIPPGCLPPGCIPPGCLPQVQAGAHQANFTAAPGLFRCLPPPVCIPRCWPPRCLPPLCLPPTCIPPGCLPPPCIM